MKTSCSFVKKLNVLSDDVHAFQADHPSILRIYMGLGRRSHRQTLYDYGGVLRRHGIKWNIFGYIYIYISYGGASAERLL